MIKKIINILYSQILIKLTEFKINIYQEIIKDIKLNKIHNFNKTSWNKKLFITESIKNGSILFCSGEGENLQQYDIIIFNNQYYEIINIEYLNEYKNMWCAKLAKATNQ